MPTCHICGKSFPNRIVIDDVVHNLHSRKYCLECSPFGGHNTKNFHYEPKPHKCQICGEIDPSKFYGHKRTICGKCHNQYTLIKGKEKRIFAIEVLGNKCACCGYDKYPCSLDIHHLDPLIKDEHFARMRGWSKIKILAEIKNCILLCKNCHAALHSGYKIL